MVLFQYDTPLVYDDGLVYELVGEDAYYSLIQKDFDAQFEKGGAYKNGIYHKIPYKYLFWMIIKDYNFLTMVLEDQEVHFIRSDHVPNFEWDRPFTTKEIYAFTGGIAGAVCVLALSIVGGLALLGSVAASSAAKEVATESTKDPCYYLPEHSYQYEDVKNHFKYWRWEARRQWKEDEFTEVYCLDLTKEDPVSIYTDKYGSNKKFYQYLFRAVAEEFPGTYRKTIRMPDTIYFGGIYDYVPEEGGYVKRPLNRI